MSECGKCKTVRFNVEGEKAFDHVKQEVYTLLSCLFMKDIEGAKSSCSFILSLLNHCETNTVPENVPRETQKNKFEEEDFPFLNQDGPNS